MWTLWKFQLLKSYVLLKIASCSKPNMYKSFWAYEFGLCHWVLLSGSTENTSSTMGTKWIILTSTQVWKVQWQSEVWKKYFPSESWESCKEQENTPRFTKSCCYYWIHTHTHGHSLRPVYTLLFYKSRRLNHQLNVTQCLAGSLPLCRKNIWHMWLEARSRF